MGRQCPRSRRALSVAQFIAAIGGILGSWVVGIAMAQAQVVPQTIESLAKPEHKDPDAAKPWTIQFEPVVWFVGPSGKVKLPVTSGTGPGGFTTEGDKVRLSALDLENTLLRPAGEVHINADQWRFTFAGSDYSTSRPGTVAQGTFRLGSVALTPGDRFDASFSMGTYELSAGYCVWEHDFKEASEHPEDAVPVLMKLYVLAGGRVYNTKFDVRRTTGGVAEARADEFFAEPIAGARFEADITKAFGIDLQISGGGWPVGNHSSHSFDVSLGFHYRPFENVGVQLGYRQIIVGLQDGSDLGQFRYDGTLAGLYAGVVVRF